MSTRPRTFDLDCKLAYTLERPTDFLFQIHAMNALDQTVESESLTLRPHIATHVYADPYVQHRFMRLQVPAGAFSLRYRARVQVRRPRAPADLQEAPVAELPDEILHNLMPTRYCESDLLGSAALKLFCDLKPGLSRVQAICDWIHRNVEYRAGSTDSTSTARDVFVQRAGVCRDFAHLGVTFCRALNIPARLAVGYAVFRDEPPDFHAMFEAWLGGRWVLFDPTRMSSTNDLVRVAVGRDAKDVAFATIFGAARTRAIVPAITRVS